MPTAPPPMLRALALQSGAMRAAPRLAAAFAGPPHEAHERAASPVPISPSEVPNDAQLFEHPTDSGIRYWLPRYRLRQTQGRYHISSALDDDGSWAVSFGLEQVPPPELLEAARLAQPLGHQREFVVRYAAAQSGIERQHLASEVSEEAAGIALTLRLTLEERDGLLRAFRSDAANARIVVTRRVEVAVPVAASVARPVWPLLQMPPLPRPPPAPRYAARGFAFESSLSLRFDQAEHPYLFPSSMERPPQAEFERILLRYPPDDPNGRMHAYFRDVTRANRFYFLPDDFRLARIDRGAQIDRPRFVPALKLRVDQADADDTEQVQMTCALRPHTNPARIAQATQALQAHVTVQGHEQPAVPQLQPLAAKSELRLALPRDGTLKTVDVAADVDLANGMVVSERFMMDDDFQDVWAALKGSELAALLRGNVKVTTGLASDDLVPVRITTALTEGEVFVTSELYDADRGGVSVELRNGTESALRIAALPAWIKCGSQITEARLDGLNLAAPVDLAANDQLKFTARPLVPLTGEGRPDVVFDISAVQPLPALDTLLPLILDGGIAQERRIRIEVVTTTELLAGDRPQNAVSMVVIEFKGNVNVILDANTLRQKVAVPILFGDWLLELDTAGFYRYRQTIVYREGGRTETSDWRRDDDGVLVVPKS